MARDMIRQVQQLRKDYDLEENDRIAITWSAVAGEAELEAMVAEWHDTILTETRADRIESGTTPDGKTISVGEIELGLAIARR